MHLGGQDSITAYNIEDNELWTRHVLTAVSQITVAIFVFSKSWRGGDKRLFKAAIMFFIPGVLKCLEKPWILKNASINSLVSSPDTAHGMTSKVDVDEVKTLQGYLQEATTDCVETHANREVQEQSDSVDSLSKMPPHILQPSRLFVDVASSYADHSRFGKPRLSGLVAQYSLIGFFSRNKKVCIVSLLQCKDFLNQRWCMKPCDSSFFIAKLVLQYVKSGWKYQIKNVDSYWKFNDQRGQWTLENKCNQDLIWSLRRPFDESVLLWHITTDFCYYYMGASVDHQCAIAR
jgi:hypothetical protein